MRDGAAEPAFRAWCDRIAFGPGGLVPVAVEDASAGGLLMVAYADRAALEATRRTGWAHFYSRSRGSPWEKGASSGHRLRVVSMAADCDRDAVRYRVVATGPACHTGAASCFFEEAPGGGEGDGAPTGGGDPGSVAPAPGPEVLEAVYGRIRARQAAPEPDSYVAGLLSAGPEQVLKKVAEEATEVVLAGMAGDPRALVRETADLWFHSLVALAVGGVEPGTVWAELQARAGRRRAAAG